VQRLGGTGHAAQPGHLEEHPELTEGEVHGDSSVPGRRAVRRLVNCSGFPEPKANEV
jgi:hypothetical protein